VRSYVLPNHICRRQLYFSTITLKLIKQLFVNYFLKQTTHSDTILDNTLQACKNEQNIRQMCSVVKDNSLLLAAEANRGIVNVFKRQKATLEQETDLLTLAHKLT